MNEFRNSDVIFMHVTQFTNAVCTRVDPDIMMPTNEKDASRIQRGLCVACKYKSDCLELAISFGAEGIWGATDTAERKAIIRNRIAKGEFVPDAGVKLCVGRPKRSKVSA